MEIIHPDFLSDSHAAFQSAISIEKAGGDEGLRVFFFRGGARAQGREWRPELSPGPAQTMTITARWQKEDGCHDGRACWVLA